MKKHIITFLIICCNFLSSSIFVPGSASSQIYERFDDQKLFLDQSSLFQSRIVYHTNNLSALPQWQNILQSWHKLFLNDDLRAHHWRQFVDSLEQDSPTEQISKVHAWFNGFPYRDDQWTYGEKDYWSSPTEFLDHGGDCEDFAIIKYVTLRELGFSDDQMKILIVHDAHNNMDHAFLVVYHDDEKFILDNRSAKISKTYYRNRYQPYYAFNERTLWTYDQPLMARKIKVLQQDITIQNND